MDSSVSPKKSSRNGSGDARREDRGCRRVRRIRPCRAGRWRSAVSRCAPAHSPALSYHGIGRAQEAVILAATPPARSCRRNCRATRTRLFVRSSARGMRWRSASTVVRQDAACRKHLCAPNATAHSCGAKSTAPARRGRMAGNPKRENRAIRDLGAVKGRRVAEGARTLTIARNMHERCRRTLSGGGEQAGEIGGDEARRSRRAHGQA